MENALAKKLKIKEGMQVALLNEPAGFKKGISPLPKGVKLTDKAGECGLVILFVSTKAEFEKQIAKTASMLAKDGLLWLCFPKGSSGIQTDLTRDRGWESLSKFNLSHVSLISVNDQWSAFAVRSTASGSKPVSPKKADTNNDVAKYIDIVNRVVTLPPFLDSVLKKDKTANEMYQSLSYTNKKEYVVWILDTKQEETKQKRIKMMVEKLRAGLKNPSDK